MFKTLLYQATHAGIMFWFGGNYVRPVSKLPAYNTWRMWLKRVGQQFNRILVI